MKNLTTTQKLERQLKIAKSFEIVELARIENTCKFNDLVGSEINIFDRTWIDNISEFKAIFKICFGKKIEKKEWLKLFKAIKVWKENKDEFFQMNRQICNEIQNKKINQ